MALDKLVDSEQLNNDLTVVANAIRAKGETSASLAFPNGFVSAIEDIQTGGGGGGSATDDVVFYDYDGSVAASYSSSDFANLTAMPANPSHTGLIAQGWNWSLANAKAYVAKYGKLNIGQMYITDDGKTRVYIHLEQGRTSPMLGVRPNGTVDVDWGDGTAHDTLTGTSTLIDKWTPTHNYVTPGDYVIKLTVTGSMGFYDSGTSNQYSGLLRYSSSDDTRNRAYHNAIKKIEIGNGVTNIVDYAFAYCFSLSSITIPNSVTSIGNSAFRNCYSLSSIAIPDSATTIWSSAFINCYSISSIAIPNSVTSSIKSSTFYNCYSLPSVAIPDGVTSIDNSAFNNCQSLSSVVIPDGVTSIGTTTFGYCYSLSSVVIPDSVTSIGGYAFRNCSSVKEYHFLQTTPPTLSSSAFTDIPADCIIYVPTASLNTYKTTSNWSTHADKMQGE